jgi:hypothetical protein
VDTNEKKTCEQACEVWSRVVGYYRPTNNWNKGKQHEFALRRPFVVNSAAVDRIASPASVESPTGKPKPR